MRLGIVQTQSVGRAGVHTINEAHASIPHLRALADPVGLVRAAVDEVVALPVESVIIFGSIARGEASEDSDVDLAVIADPGWVGRSDLEDNVSSRLGNACEVLVFTPAEFDELAQAGEPVVRDIVRDGVALVGTVPRVTAGAA